MASAPEHLTKPTEFSEHLELLVEMGNDFASSLDIDDTLEKALARIAHYVNAEAASLFLLENDDHELVCRACYGPTNIAGLRIGAGEGIVGRSVQDNRCQIVRDVRLDPDFAKSIDEDTGFRTLSILCAPLSVKDRRVGALEVLNKLGGDGLFSDQDRQLLEGLASSAALAIINARLTSAVIEQQKIRRELELAAGDPKKPSAARCAQGVSGCGGKRAGAGSVRRFLRHLLAARWPGVLQRRRRLRQGNERSPPHGEDVEPLPLSRQEHS